MKSLTTSLLAASTAVAVGMSGAVAAADPVVPEETAVTTGDYADRASVIDQGVAVLEYLALTAKNGKGTMPQTDGASKMVAGSIQDLGMNGEATYYATQAGWGILWTVLAIIGAGGIYTAAKQAGVIQ